MVVGWVVDDFNGEYVNDVEIDEMVEDEFGDMRDCLVRVLDFIGG